MPKTLNIKKKSNQAKKPGETAALKLFHQAAQRVPAYGDFLKRNRINHEKIRTIEDFRQVPWVDKKNYLMKYSLSELSWDGELFNSRIISVSSGSTGQPFFWPRGLAQDEEGAWMHERLFTKVFDIQNQTSLVVICFSMGTWIAGSFTTASTLKLAEKGYKLNVVTPGIEKDEAIKVIKNLAPNYDQVILCGYPPFIKDIIDEGYHEGIRWRKLKTRFLWAGEAFSEEWRNFVLKRAGSKDVYSDSVNIYGTADAAMMGHETPVSIALRKLFNRKKRLAKEVFGSDILPSIAQYYPERRYIEGVAGEVVFTANSGLPLLRYNIHDAGGVFEYRDLVAPVEEEFRAVLEENAINESDWQLPFIFIKGRKDFTVTIYAVNIYPENIKAALVDPRMRSWVTGKFTMATKYYSDMDQYFEVNIELAKGVSAEPGYQDIATATILNKLEKLNAEFRKLHNAIGKKAIPHIHLVKYGDKEYFAAGIKHRWVKKKDGPRKAS